MSHPGYRGSVGQRVAEMLQNTPEEFHDELKACLEPRPPLLWLHQLRSEDYIGARRRHCARETGAPRRSATLAERRRYLSLAKLSLLADGVSSSSDDVIAIDAALDLAAIQTRLARRRGGDGDGDAPLPPLRLVEACLNEGEGAGVPGARRIFSTRSRRSRPRESAFRASNKSLLGGMLAKNRGGDGLGGSLSASRIRGGHSVRPGAQRHVRRARGKTVLRRICGASRRAVLGGVENRRGAEAAGGCAGGRRGAAAVRGRGWASTRTAAGTTR